jgi:ABC-2 type transport system ATP-binding protein
VVAVDTPANLSRRLSGSETMFVQVDAAKASEAAAALARVGGVMRVAPTDNLPGAFEVESEAGRDVRRDLARAVVSGGCDLLELRPMRVSLEEIFLSLTTEEKPEEAAS